MLHMDESFPHLSHAPIIEAVIDIRVQFGEKWNQDTIKDVLKSKLPDYPNIEEQRKWKAEITAKPKTIPSATAKDLGLNGYVFRTKEKLYVAQFQRDGYIFSRLKPYEDWNSFIKEAHRLWIIYCKIISPIEITRLGVRFINRIEASQIGKIDDYLTDVPKSPSNFNWTFSNFFHRDVFIIPDEPYEVNFIRLLERAEAQTIFIIDIDVYMTSSLELRKMWNDLKKMRYYKNKIFFESINNKILEKMK